jgi:hypothetical protein
MYDDSLLQTLYGLLQGTNAPLTKRQFINDLNAFILDHIPYAQVRLRDLQLGLISFDGRQTGQDREQKPILVWHFGGLPYPIAKAASIEYNYVRTWDGSGQSVHATIVLGFQEDVEHVQLPTQPRAHLGPRRTSFSDHIASQDTFIKQLTETVAGLTNTVPAAVVSGAPAFSDLDSFVNAQILAPRSAVARVATPVDGSAVAGHLVALGARAAFAEPQQETPQPDAGQNSQQAGEAESGEPTKDIVQSESGQTPDRSGQTDTGAPSTGVVTSNGGDGAAQRDAMLLDYLSRIAVGIEQLSGTRQAVPIGLTSFQTEPFNVEFEGPAKDADSHHVFPYTLETLFNDQALFNQILWWYFAGKPMRITKAMRIPLGSGANGTSLFVGYSGPGIQSG